MLHMFACGATVQVRVPPFTVCLPFSSLHCLVAMQPLQVVLDTTASDDELTNFLSRLSVALQRRLLRLLHYLEDQRTGGRCQCRCANPRCSRLCGRRLRVPVDNHINHACKRCHREGW